MFPGPPRLNTPLTDPAPRNLTWSAQSVTPAMRSDLKGHTGKCFWLTGLSGAGKSTLANALETALNRQGFHTMLLDGDNLRHGLCRDLGMSAEDRSENIRRVGEVARLMADSGLIVITALISPFAKDRDAVRALFPENDFLEIYVDTPLALCEARDPKGLYRKARQGLIPDFTGIDSPYEPPSQPALAVHDCTDDTVARLIQLCRPLH